MGTIAVETHPATAVNIRTEGRLGQRKKGEASHVRKMGSCHSPIARTSINTGSCAPHHQRHQQTSMFPCKQAGIQGRVTNGSAGGISSKLPSFRAPASEACQSQGPLNPHGGGPRRVSPQNVTSVSSRLGFAEVLINQKYRVTELFIHRDRLPSTPAERDFLPYRSKSKGTI